MAAADGTRLLYFDNSATSWPKPACVSAAMMRYMDGTGGSYGRSFSDRALAVNETIESAREALAGVFACAAERIFFTSGATMGMNIALRRLPKRGREIWISPLEHNCVTRTIANIKRSDDVSIHILPAGRDGCIDIGRLQGADTANWRGVVINHMSNVNGVVQPVAAVRRMIGEVPLIVDASQSFGCSMRPDDWPALAGICDFIVMTGHKKLMGPPGVGAVYVKDPERIAPFLHGGTAGGISRPGTMPLSMPEKMEAGTPNIPGIYGLAAALDYWNGQRENGFPDRGHQDSDFREFLAAIQNMEEYDVFCTRQPDMSMQGEVFSLRPRNSDASELALRLYERYRIESRFGAHCAPLAHYFLGTYRTGTVRLSCSYFHTARDFEYVIDALRRCM